MDPVTLGMAKTAARKDIATESRRVNALRKTIAAPTLYASLGSPNLATIGRTAAWMLDPAVNEAIGVVVSDLPPEWHGRTAYVEVQYGCAAGSVTSGNVAARLQFAYARLRANNQGAGLNPTLLAAATYTCYIPATEAFRMYRIPGSFVVDVEQSYFLRIIRQATDPLDLFTGDLAVMSVRLVSPASLTGDTILTPHAGASWWSLPRAAKLPSGRLVSGGCSSPEGEIVIGDSITRFLTARLESDEHNVPSVLATPGKAIITATVGHGSESQVRIRRSTTGDIADLGAVISVPFVAGCTYGQLLRVPGTDTVWVLTRTDDGNWSRSVSTDDGLTWSVSKAIFQQAGGSGKGYTLTRQVGSIVRVAVYGHPTESTYHQIRVAQIDMSTGAITTPTAGTSLGNIDSLPAPVPSASLELAYDADAHGVNVRLFDLGAGPEWEIAVATWTTDDDTVYRVVSRAAGVWTASAAICAAGVVMGYTPNIHYHGGCSFPEGATAGGIMLSAREAAGIWYLERWDLAAGTWTATPIRSSRRKLYRPYAPAPGGLVWNEAGIYEDFTVYEADVVAALDWSL